MTNTTKKLTKRDHFNALLRIPEVSANSQLVDFINHELELLNKKNSTEKKPSEKQVANASIAEAIVSQMKPDRLYTITELIKEIPECADLTNQRVSAILRPMWFNTDSPSVERIEDKRKTYFRVISE